MSERRTLTPTNIIIALLVGTVVFVLVTTMRDAPESRLEGLSEAELVRLFEDVDSRIGELVSERDTLHDELAELQTGADTQAAAAEAAAQQEMVRKVQAGVVPVEGPGITIRIRDSAGQMPAQSLVTLVQELRNSAAEAIEINGVRVVTRTSIITDSGSIAIDGVTVASPYTIRAIGDSDMMRVALEMPGGILSAIRSRGPSTDVTQNDLLQIESTAELPEFVHATPLN